MGMTLISIGFFVTFRSACIVQPDCIPVPGRANDTSEENRMRKLIASTLLLLSSIAIAEMVEPASEAWYERDQLTGNWGGIRDSLEESGITPFIVYDSIFGANVSGGIQSDEDFAGQVYAGLNMDLEKLEAARRRGKVKKREYMIRERDLKQQIEEIDSSLPNLRNDMISYGPRYRDLVAQLELQDERIEGAKAGLRQLLLRKKKQRISRAAFEKSRQDYLKTIQKATTATDRILLSIQEEAGEL